MRATVMRQGALVVDDLDDPTPGPGQVLVRTVACGICGSDLHALAHTEEMIAMTRAGGSPMPGMPDIEVMDPARDVVLGHEFSAEVVELGANTGNRAVGDLVVSMPIAFDSHGLHPLGYSNTYPGGYGELMVLSEMLTLEVPNGLSGEHASLTEPMAVGHHAVNKSWAGQGHAAVVMGCGPVGLAVIAALALAGIEPIVAADFSPTRRRLASVMGAHRVVDPSSQPAVEAWRELDGRKRLVIFEAVGMPGMLEQAMGDAPRGSQIIVVGVCMTPDRVLPGVGVVKELNMQFVFGYDPVEFAETLRHIAEGEIDVEPLITGTVGLDGVARAFEDLSDPDVHAKILVTPRAWALERHERTRSAPSGS